jgi:hypothetical protein
MIVHNARSSIRPLPDVKINMVLFSLGHVGLLFHTTASSTWWLE